MADIRRQNDRGFTLVELLVVMAIIAVLVAMLIPALSGAQRQVRKAQCLNNLRAIAASVTLYAADNECKLPYHGTPGFGWPDESFNYGQALLKPYIANASFFICPMDSEPPFNVWWTTIGYGSQNGLGGTAYPWPSSYYYGFANYHRFSWSGGVNDPGPARQMRVNDVKQASRRGIYQCAAVWGGPGAHGPAAMLGFMDGHAAYVPLVDLAFGQQEGSPLGYWHFDWTINGLGGSDLK